MTKHTHDHIADAIKKVQPASEPLCGGDEIYGCSYHCGDPECAQNQPAPAELEGEDTSEGCAKPAPPTGVTWMPKSKMHPIQPAPAPLLEDVAWELRELSAYASQNPGTPLAHIYDRITSHISAQARRLAEAEAENGRFAGMLEDSVSGWRKLYTEERAERVRIEGILLNDVQAERQESDEHINGLNVVIKTQDKTIRDLKSRVVELAADWQVQFAKAEAAEASVRELEAQLSGVGVSQYREAVERLDNSEYTISLDGSQDDMKQMWEDIDTLIAHARAVQAPRLTEGQMEAVKVLLNCMRLAGWEDDHACRAARAAFALGGEEG